MKKNWKNIYLTNIKAQNGFCVGGLLYRIKNYSREIKFFDNLPKYFSDLVNGES